MERIDAERGSAPPGRIEDRLRRVIAVHFDPRTGSPFWLDRAAAMGIDAIGEVRRLPDLARLGRSSIP